MNRVRLLVFNPVLSVLDYRLPAGMAMDFGQLVIAPLGPRQVLGIVWEPDRLAGDEVPEAKLRSILEVLPVPPLSKALRGLIEWTADYYVAPMNAVARMALGSMAALRGGGTTTEYRLSGHEPKRLTPQRAAAMDALDGEQASIRELAALASVSEGVLRGMVGAGILEPVTVDLDRPYPRARADFAVPELSEAQQGAAGKFVEAVRSGGFTPFLLDGVTGSGKTECYFEAIAEAIRQKRQVLVLLPEIALTENFLRRFEARFGTPPVAGTV